MLLAQFMVIILATLTPHPYPNRARSPTTAPCQFSVADNEFRILRASSPSQLMQFQSGALDGGSNVGGACTLD